MSGVLPVCFFMRKKMLNFNALARQNNSYKKKHVKNEEKSEIARGCEQNG